MSAPVPAEPEQTLLLRELRSALSASYSLSPEGRAYLRRIDSALANPIETSGSNPLLCSVCGRWPHPFDDPLCCPESAGPAGQVRVLQRRIAQAERDLEQANKSKVSS